MCSSFGENWMISERRLRGNRSEWLKKVRKWMHGCVKSQEIMRIGEETFDWSRVWLSMSDLIETNLLIPNADLGGFVKCLMMRSGLMGIMKICGGQVDLKNLDFGPKKRIDSFGLMRFDADSFIELGESVLIMMIACKRTQ